MLQAEPAVPSSWWSSVIISWVIAKELLLVSQPSPRATGTITATRCVEVVLLPPAPCTPPPRSSDGGGGGRAGSDSGSTAGGGAEMAGGTGGGAGG